MSEPVVIFGDVHGRSDILASLLHQARARYGAGAALYSLGDLIDRGPDSKGCINLCVREGVQGILGNHELWLCSVLAGHPMSDGPYSQIMGGLATVRSYGLERGDPDHVGAALRAAVPRAQQEWLLSLPPYRIIEIGSTTYALVHAGIASGLYLHLAAEVPGLNAEQVLHILSEHTSDTFFWTGPNPSSPSEVARLPGVTQVFGHTPNRKPLESYGHYISLDTGCGLWSDGVLSAVALLPNGRREFLSAR